MKFNKYFRFLLGASCLLAIYSLYLPIWEIYLWAPQYPEGLSVQIWHNDVRGDVDIINGLNHYIGMKHIKTEMFPEFKVLIYLILAFIGFGFLTALIGSVKLLKAFLITCVLGGIIALADFYRWGYDYGHNLDPTAPIQVPGMAYQPPIIGYKDLLNFTALSMPSSGGWLIISVAVIAFVALIFNWLKNKKIARIAPLLVVFTLLQSCQNNIPSIAFGTDDCDFCKMKIMDKKFGIAFKTPKGKVFKFDDFHCYQSYLKDLPTNEKSTYVVCFDQPGELIESKLASFANGEQIHSPMGGGIAFFKDPNNIEIDFPAIEKKGKFEELTNE